MKEIWKKIVNHPLYEVSNCGNVRSWKNNKWGVRKKPKLLKNFPSTNYGYMGVKLDNKTNLVHHLVARAFIGPRPTGLNICHNDGNHLNNFEENLRYDTQQANIDDAKKHGKIPKGSQRYNAILTEHDIPRIRELLNQGATCPEIGKMYGVDRHSIKNIANGIGWTHV